MFFNKGKSLIVLAIIVMMSLVVSACGGAKDTQKAQVMSEGSLVIKVLDIGQGDSILIKTANHTALIDSGTNESREKLLELLDKNGITAIDTLVITHPHADHLGGATAVIDKMPVKRIFDSGQKTTTATYRNYLKAVNKKKIPFEVISVGEKIKLGDTGVVLNVFSPQKEFVLEDNGNLDLNNNSIVAKLIYKEFSMLLTGDTEKVAERLMLKDKDIDLKSTILKVAHHGSRTSTSPSFLKAVAPEVAIISLGANNEYNHPHSAVMKRLNELKVYRTDIDGTVTISTDGKNYEIAKEKK